MKKILFFLLFNMGIATNNCHGLQYDFNDAVKLLGIVAGLLSNKNTQSNTLVRVPTTIPLIGDSKVLGKDDFSKVLSTTFINSYHRCIKKDENETFFVDYSFFSSKPKRIDPSNSKIISVVKCFLIEGSLELIHRGAINITEETVKKQLPKNSSPKKAWIFSKLSHSLASFFVQSVVSTARTLKNPDNHSWQHPTLSMPSRAGLVFDIKPDTEKSIDIDVNLEFGS